MQVTATGPGPGFVHNPTQHCLFLFCKKRIAYCREKAVTVFSQLHTIDMAMASLPEGKIFHHVCMTCVRQHPKVRRPCLGKSVWLGAGQRHTRINTMSAVLAGMLARVSLGSLPRGDNASALPPLHLLAAKVLEHTPFPRASAVETWGFWAGRPQSSYVHLGCQTLREGTGQSYLNRNRKQVIFAVRPRTASPISGARFPSLGRNGGTNQDAASGLPSAP